MMPDDDYPHPLGLHVTENRERATRASLAAPAGSARSLFEQWISGPPYERDLYRWPMDETKHAWPGQYKDIAVQLAWESWQQAQNDQSLATAGAGLPKP